MLTLIFPKMPFIVMKIKERNLSEEPYVFGFRLGSILSIASVQAKGLIKNRTASLLNFLKPAWDGQILVEPYI